SRRRKRVFRATPSPTRFTYSPSTAASWTSGWGISARPISSLCCQQSISCLGASSSRSRRRGSAEVELRGPGVGEQLRARPGEGDAAAVEHGAVVGGGESGARVLLDEQDGLALFAEPGDRLEDQVPRARLESHRRLVQ